MPSSQPPQNQYPVIWIARGAIVFLVLSFAALVGSIALLLMVMVS